MQTFRGLLNDINYKINSEIHLKPSVQLGIVQLSTLEAKNASLVTSKAVCTTRNHTTVHFMLMMLCRSKKGAYNGPKDTTNFTLSKVY